MGGRKGGGWVGDRIPGIVRWELIEIFASYGFVQDFEGLCLNPWTLFFYTTSTLVHLCLDKYQLAKGRSV